MPYEDGHRLTATVSHSPDLAADASPEDIADWAFHAFNADLDQLQHGRTSTAGEAAFLAACVYRLLGLRSLSVGDIVAISTGQNTDTCWLACEPSGWRRVSAPSNIHGELLIADEVDRHIHSRWGKR